MDVKMMLNAKEQFATHKATLIQDTERYTIIDWKRADGDGNYYINFIVDKKRGSLIVSGDLGDSIATWYNPVKVASLARWIKNDISYYIGKFQCTSDAYVYNDDTIFSSIWDDFDFEDDEDVQAFIDDINEHRYLTFMDKEDLIDKLYEEIGKGFYSKGWVPTEELLDIICYNNPDEAQNLSDWFIGDISPRVYLWAYGFHMACEQLGLL